jgi:hypothetical protein
MGGFGPGTPAVAKGPEFDEDKVIYRIKPGFSLVQVIDWHEAVPGLCAGVRREGTELRRSAVARFS